MRAFEQWLIDEAPKVMPKSPIGKAIAYTYNIFYYCCPVNQWKPEIVTP